jgi:hypothetical protein
VDKPNSDLLETFLRTGNHKHGRACLMETIDQYSQQQSLSWHDNIPEYPNYYENQDQKFFGLNSLHGLDIQVFKKYVVALLCYFPGLLKTEIPLTGPNCW